MNAACLIRVMVLSALVVLPAGEDVCVISLLDHLVGAGEQHGGYFDSERTLRLSCGNAGEDSEKPRAAGGWPGVLTY